MPSWTRRDALACLAATTLATVPPSARPASAAEMEVPTPQDGLLVIGPFSLGEWLSKSVKGPFGGAAHCRSATGERLQHHQAERFAA